MSSRRPHIASHFLRLVGFRVISLIGIVVGSWLNLCGPHGRAAAQVIDVPRGERLSFDEEETLAPGLLGRFEQRQGDRPESLQQDARRFRLAAWQNAKNAAATPFLEPRETELVLTGYLWLELPGQFGFYCDTNDEFTLEINGVTVLKLAPREETAGETLVPVHAELPAGHLALRIRTRTSADRDSRFRLYWQGNDFAAEPIPPTLLFHNGSDPQLLAADQLRLGRELFATHNCVRCHAADNTHNASRPKPTMPKPTMPELSRQNPSLQLLGRRLRPEWIAHWLLSPSMLRNHVTMPGVIPGDAKPDADVASSRHQIAADLAAYLTESGDAEPHATPAEDVAPTVLEVTEQLVSEGEGWFESLGCIACHHFQSPGAEDYFARTSLHFVGAKFASAMALADFLRDPRRRYGSSRMPNFGLSQAEANALAAFVGDRASGKLSPIATTRQADPQRGREHFVRLRCAACHDEMREIAGNQFQPVDVPIAADRTSLGCLGESADRQTQGLRSAPASAAPAFALSSLERDALMAFWRSDRQSLHQRVNTEYTERFIAQRQCTRCHQRDDAAGQWAEVLAEEGTHGTAPETVPPLTWVGEKLQAAWTQKLLTGTLEYRARPWLKARMPSFGDESTANMSTFVHGLSAEHAYDPPPKQTSGLAAATAEQVQTGFELTKQAKGFFCVECHAVGQQPAIGAFAHHGVNFQHIRERLHYEYYRRWIIDPIRVDANSKMPKFSPDGVTSPKQEFYGGDIRQQFDSVWQYLQSLNATK